jgi:hypothetical protein
MVVCTCPEGNKVTKRPREIVTRVSVNGLEETKRDPDVDGEDVEIATENAVEEWTAYGSHSEDEDLNRVRVFGCLGC